MLCVTLERTAAELCTQIRPPPWHLRIAKGAGKLRHINISTLWIQEKQDLHQLAMRKVLGTDNPADLMTKYLTRSVIDTHLQFMGHHRADGRAQAGLKVQGKTATAVNGRAVGHPNHGNDPNKKLANKSRDDIVLFQSGRQIHKRHTQSWCESTCPLMMLFTGPACYRGRKGHSTRVLNRHIPPYKT